MLQAYMSNNTIDSWKVGETMDILTYKGAIDSILIDGDELEYVKTHFSNLPSVSTASNNYVVKYYGEMARFIVGNILSPYDTTVLEHQSSAPVENNIAA